MRLPEGIVVDAEATFGELKFSAFRRERYVQDEEGKSTGELKERTYDLKSKGQGMMIQVSIPAEAGEKTFAYNDVVELVGVSVDTVATATYAGRADANWYIKAEDIVLKGKATNAAGTEKAAGTDTTAKTHVQSDAAGTPAKKG